MGWKPQSDIKIDPSGITQHFTDINLKVHCCRYWKLNEWEFKNLSFPFWRLYYNTTEGASVSFKERKVFLSSENVILIPPYTSFSTSLKNLKDERLSGGRIDSVEEFKHIKDMGMVDHLFIHFNLGFQYDTLHSDIYEFKVQAQIKELLDSIRMLIIDEYVEINFKSTLKIYSLLLLLVNMIPIEKWGERSIDSRVMKTINYIEKNFAEEMTNDFLARKVSMSPNSFLRLFKSETVSTIQRFIQEKRIEKAILMIHNNNDTIEIIAEKCGFKDRQHFSKVFKRVNMTTPAHYRKNRMI